MNRAIESNLNDLIGPNIDLTQVVAEIHVYAMCLEAYEPGLWWDSSRLSTRFLHPAFSSWLDHYGFSSLHDMPRDALIAVNISMRKHLEKKQPC